MSQTSIERLRDYLVQLPPQSQALLMREFERAIERGEDATVATFVLEQLRKIVRGANEELRPRADDPARLLFRPLEPFLAESNYPVRPGQIRRTSLPPVWQWLIRDGATDQAREFEAALARTRDTGATSDLEAAVRKLQLVAADAISKIGTPSGDRQRSLARVGPPEVVEDLLSIGAVFQAREARTPSTGGFSYLRILRIRRSRQWAPHSMFPRLKAASAAVRAVAGNHRLTAPWQSFASPSRWPRPT
jgi:hypothetical protein